MVKTFKQKQLLRHGSAPLERAWLSGESYPDLWNAWPSQRCKQLFLFHFALCGVLFCAFYLFLLLLIFLGCLHQTCPSWTVPRCMLLRWYFSVPWVWSRDPLGLARLWLLLQLYTIWSTSTSLCKSLQYGTILKCMHQFICNFNVFVQSV